MSMHARFYGSKSIPEPIELDLPPECVVDHYNKHYLTDNERELWWSTFIQEDRDDMIEESQRG